MRKYIHLKHLTWHFLRPLESNLNTTKFVLAILEYLKTKIIYHLNKAFILIKNSVSVQCNAIYRLRLAILLVDGARHLEMLLRERIHLGHLDRLDKVGVVGAKLMVQTHGRRLEEVKRRKAVTVAELFAVELVVRRAQYVLER